MTGKEALERLERIATMLENYIKILEEKKEEKSKCHSYSLTGRKFRGDNATLVEYKSKTIGSPATTTVEYADTKQRDPITGEVLD